jgi:hypothetical protein
MLARKLADVQFTAALTHVGVARVATVAIMRPDDRLGT